MQFQAVLGIFVVLGGYSSRGYLEISLIKINESDFQPNIHTITLDRFPKVQEIISCEFLQETKKSTQFFCQNEHHQSFIG